MSTPTLSTANTLEKITHSWNTLQDIDNLIDWIGEAKYVLLGGASYGTHEYQLSRSQISRQLIAKKGFSFIAVEGDWQDCYRINKYVKHYPGADRSAHQALQSFTQWPAWTWANHETTELVTWLHSYNADRNPKKRVGFYGLDAYNLRHLAYQSPTAPDTEHHYPSMLQRNVDTWNIRNQCMMETLSNLMRRYEPNAKTIIWAHNALVTDARYTDMHPAGMFNLGQLARQAYGEDNVVLIGFGSYRGQVAAARQWGAAMEIMDIPPAPDGTWESDLHTVLPKNKLLLSEEVGNRGELWRLKGHRSIGAVYDPKLDENNYTPTLLPGSYDAFIYFDHTTALNALHTPRTQKAAGP